MTKTLRMVAAAALFTSIAISQMACAHVHREGPLEKAGRKTDDAASDVKHDAKNATD
jgi:hypothetical protein